MSNPDHRYIEKTLKGEINAFGKLVEMHQSFAFRTAISIVKNETITVDIVQESFIKAFENLSSFREDSKFSSWLCRIVINESLLFLRKNDTTDVLDSEEISTDQSYVNEGLSNLEKQDLENILKKGLNRIASKEALIIQLFYLEEFTIQEIKKMTDFTESNIKVLLHRGRKNLYKQLHKIYQNERR